MYSEVIKKEFKELTNEEIYQILDLRSKVFVMEQQIMYVDTDYKDQKSIHYMIKDDDQIVCYLRLIPPYIKFNEYALSRVVTDPNYRSKGLASKLIVETMNDIKGFPVRISGQAYLKSYYEGLGFEVVKGPYLEEDIEHYEMLHLNK
ncbi:MAG: GNAT family N-acetyltransferase [Acholeplasmataceae bacterium]|nr:GNAT family N-acetyltransferase [Acholeplasmataceae bacterium]